MNNQISYHEAQLVVDREIANLPAHEQHSIQLLKTRRNELAPVSRLPDEILLYIFLVLRDLYFHPETKWQMVTHICRHWRHVAIGSPALWTRLDMPPPALIPLMLERSRSAPLDVHLQAPDPTDSITTLTTILLEIKRIRTLRFSTVPDSFLDVAHDILAGLDQDWEASLLESLSIGIFSRGEPYTTPVKLAMDVFRPTHRLRKLRLSGGCYSWGMLPLPNLTHLELYGKCLGAVSGAQFMEALRPMQKLERLSMNWEQINIHQFPPTPHPQPIYLPCLQRLDISYVTEAHFESFLSLVIHPKLHYLDIDPSYPVIDTPTFTKSVLSSSQKANFGPLEFLKIEEYCITMSSSSRIDVSSHSDSSSLIRMFLLPPSDVGVEDDTPFEFVMDIMSCITSPDYLDELPLNHVYMISPYAPIGEFIRIFASLPHLETIEVHHDLALVLFEALDIAHASFGTNPNTSIPFPKLRTIIWHGLYHARTAPSFSSAVFNVCYSGLVSRYTHGVPITGLELVGCEHLEETQASQLEEIGVKVVITRFTIM
ncbi:hypothetical protein D9619_010043 [Psilocybe cf. subviscida]|uniref:F-box domain-containing protein n=1 Tax=Psilocybe cf. subviscida TaxID=2480587 RepID=A0A8H5BLI4_9AGAR|nr:hypothetical protein D9619_010043 [Psilocybe cf. subviscida]